MRFSTREVKDMGKGSEERCRGEAKKRTYEGKAMRLTEVQETW